MTVVRDIAEHAAIGVGVVDRPDALSVLHRPGQAAAIWQRRPLPRFQAWLVLVLDPIDDPEMVA